MRKISVVLSVLLLCSLVWSTAVMAVPAKRDVFVHVQSDGSSVTLMVAGDEWSHGIVTASDRLAVKQVANGDYCYVVNGEVTSMVAHNEGERGVAELTLIERQREQMGVEQISGRRIAREESNDDPQVPCMDSPRIPIILVNYTDVQFVDDDPVATFEAQFNTNQLSCLNYFKDQSRGLFTPQFDILGPVQLDTVRSYYGGNDSYGYDKQLGTMVVEAVEGLKDSVDYSVYDNDGDGIVDVVIVLYAGVGEAQASRTVPSSVWPCQWSLDECYEWGYSTKGSFELNGVTINKFAVFNELSGSSNSGTTIDGIGTFCHEFSHCLGLPDFYPTNNASSYGMDSWSLMDYGCYNANGNVPVGYDAYERHFMGWIDLIEPVKGEKYTMTPINTDEGTAVKITNAANSDEYYLVEYRKRSGWDLYCAASGLMITHVDYNKKAWTDNTVNNTSSHQRMTIIPADNRLSSSTNKGDLWPYNGLDSLTNYSTPAAKVFSGTYMNQPLYDMEINSDGTASFVYMTADEAIVGDVNNDGEVSIADVNAIIDIILGAEVDEATEERADVNGDGEVSIADVNAVIDIILAAKGD